MTHDEVRARTQAVWDRFYSLPVVWKRSRCVTSLKGRLAFVLISKLYRQMYANTGIATDSARQSRAKRWARLIAKPAAALCRTADAGPAGADRLTAPWPPTFRFGPFCLDRGAYRLLKGDAPIALPPKVLDLLFLLVSRPSALVTKDDILQALWPDVAVTDNAITQVVSDLRQALGDSSSEPQYVQTVPRRGYRFVAQVEGAEAPAAKTAQERKTGAAAAGADTSRAEGPRTVAVMDFTNVTRRRQPRLARGRHRRDGHQRPAGDP